MKLQSMNLNACSAILVCCGLLLTVGCGTIVDARAAAAKEFISAEIVEWMSGEYSYAKQLALQTGIYYGATPIGFEIVSAVSMKTQAVRFGDYELLDSQEGDDVLIKVAVKLEFEKGRGDTTTKTIQYLVGRDSESDTWQFTQPTEKLN